MSSTFCLKPTKTRSLSSDDATQIWLIYVSPLHSFASEQGGGGGSGNYCNTPAEDDPFLHNKPLCVQGMFNVVDGERVSVVSFALQTWWQLFCDKRAIKKH